jgi:hypothetical protein
MEYVDIRGGSSVALLFISPAIGGQKRSAYGDEEKGCETGFEKECTKEDGREASSG